MDNKGCFLNPESSEKNENTSKLTKKEGRKSEEYVLWSEQRLITHKN